MNNLEKDYTLNGQSAAKPLLNEEGSEIIPRKGSRLEEFLAEKPNIIIENLFTQKKYENISCIYCIFSKSKMIPYIGSTNNLHKRCQRHRDGLKYNYHFSKYLQRVFNKYTFRDIFIFVLERVDLENISERESYWINYFDSVNNGFNAVYDTQKNFINEDIKRIISEKNSKPVLMFTLTGEFIKEFKSVKVASIEIGDQSTNVSACCNEKLRHVKGNVFRYKAGFTEFKLRESNRGSLNIDHKKKCMLSSSKKVICDNIIYDSISEAQRQNNISGGTLGKYIKYNKEYKGKLFQYYEDMIHDSVKTEL